MHRSSVEEVSRLLRCKSNRRDRNEIQIFCESFELWMDACRKPYFSNIRFQFHILAVALLLVCASVWCEPAHNHFSSGVTTRHQWNRRCVNDECEECYDNVCRKVSKSESDHSRAKQGYVPTVQPKNYFYWMSEFLTILGRTLEAGIIRMLIMGTGMYSVENWMQLGACYWLQLRFQQHQKAASEPNIASSQDWPRMVS